MALKFFNTVENTRTGAKRRFVGVSYTTYTTDWSIYFLFPGAGIKIRHDVLVESGISVRLLMLHWLAFFFMNAVKEGK